MVRIVYIIEIKKIECSGVTHGNKKLFLYLLNIYFRCIFMKYIIFHVYIHEIYNNHEDVMIDMKRVDVFSDLLE